MKVTINGESEEVGEISIQDLLKDRGLDVLKVVVEINGDILQRGDFPNTVLKPGDVVELIQFVGGG